MSGLSNKFVEMKELLTNLCQTVDVLQGRITPDLRPTTSDSPTSKTSPVMTSAITSMSAQEQALVNQLVARIEHLSVDVANFDASRQLKEDNLLLRKDLQVPT